MNRFKNLFSSFLILFSVVALSHCEMATRTGPKPVKGTYPHAVSSAMKTEYNQAENQFKAKRYDQAAQAYRAYIQAYPYNRLTDQSNYRLGQILMLKQKYRAAADNFQRLISKTPDSKMASRARVKAGISEYRLKNFTAALRHFDKVEGQHIRRHDKIKTSGLALNILKTREAPLDQKAYYYALLLDAFSSLSDGQIRKKYGSEAPPRREVVQALQTWSATPGKADSRFQRYSGVQSAPYIASRIGKKKIRKGKQFKIGVILPLSGKYKTFGQNTLGGMECASGDKVGCSGVDNIQLVVRDDGGNPGRAAAAVEELVKQEKVMAIVGPLSSSSSVAAAKKAEELDVTLISLAQKEGIPELGSNIYRFSLTPNQQVKALLSTAIKKKGKKIFGVLHPNSQYGKVFLQKFRDLAPRYNAQVVSAGGYRSSRNATEAIRQLKFGVSRTSAQLPLGFNAVFIPDSYAAVLNLLPQLDAAGINDVLFVGTNAWHDSRVASLSQGQLDDSLFLDIYFRKSKNSLVKNFVSQYQAAFGSKPSTLEAMGYDMIRFLSQGLGRKKVTKRKHFKEIMTQMSGYRGVTGLRSFTSFREARVRPYLLTVKNGWIVETR